MTYARWFGTALQLAALAALAGSVVSPAFAASTTRFVGGVGGSVRDAAGIPQMGAVVQLFNRFEKPLDKVITNVRGEFGFDGLVPDLYSIRVTLSSFMPALKRGIAVEPGMRSVLAINLANVLSSVDFLYSAPNPGPLMSEDWKWVLRGSMATRPVLRIAPVIDLTEPGQDKIYAASVFSDTRGMLRLSSGDANPFSALANQPDLGTTFALATSLFGNNQLQFSGNIGYGLSSELPTAGFRTSFSRADVAGPEVKLMMQQVNLPTRGSPLLGSQSGGSSPALRTMSVTLIERAQLAEGVDFDYGISLDSVIFLDRLNYLSPFARLSVQVAGNGVLDFGYSSGAPPVDLLNPTKEKEVDASLQRDMTALSVMPRVSLRNGNAYVQRSQNFELGYTVELGDRSFSLGAYKESVANGALNLSSPSDFYYAGDLMPELFSSSSSVFNIGRYARYGYTASATQQFGEHYSATLAYGRGGVLLTDGSTLDTNDPGELRSMIKSGQRHWARGRIAGVAPVTGTRFAASYEWTDHTSLVPGHVYLTQKSYPETGLNIRLRQPLPSFGSLPGRIEATAELRNLLAQGYLPIALADGRRLILSHSPRGLRGGVSFIF